MDYLAALIPSAGVFFLFVVAIRAMLRADRTERAAAARLEREHAAGGTPDAARSATAESAADPHDGDRPRA